MLPRVFVVFVVLLALASNLTAHVSTAAQTAKVDLSTVAQSAKVERRHPVSGRVFAPVMGVGGAGWLERAEREQEEAPSKAIEALALKPGMVIADIGAGSGYYTSRLAKKVAPSGRVYATDIQPGMIEILNRRVKGEGLTNVETILGAMDDPRLPPASIDVAIMVDVYHELQQPQVFLQRLRPALKPGGRLVLLEFRKEDPHVPILEVHKMSIAEVKAELEAEGFTIERVINVLPWQHIIVLQTK
jgi:cyclopropane fatty-acyl-phospholipid synthase-like methyltransferase